MSMSRWEATKQWTGRRWESLKQWTREKTQSRPVRWAISMLSGASLASAMHDFIPMDGAWVAFNIIATGVTFVVSTRLTSHGLSAQEEAPAITKKLVNTTIKAAMQDVVNQLNQNVNIQNNNTKLILAQLSQLFRRSSHALQRLRASRQQAMHDSAVNHAVAQELSQIQAATIAILPEQKDLENEDEAEALLTVTPSNSEVRPLQAIRLTLRIDTDDEMKQQNTDCPSFRDCLYSLRRPRNLSFFARTTDTELRQQQLESHDIPSPAGPVIVYSYQTDLEAGIQRQFY